MDLHQKIRMLEQHLNPFYILRNTNLSVVGAVEIKHKQEVEDVLKILSKQKLWLEPHKFKFSGSEDVYLGLIIHHNQICMELVQVKSVAPWLA